MIKTVSAKVDARDSLPERIQIILEGLFEVIDQFKPKQVAIEKVFVNVNPQSTLLLGQARGAAISAAVIKKLPVYEYTALQVKNQWWVQAMPKRAGARNGQTLFKIV